MTNRMDALMAREYESGGEKKSAFTKIGAAFETRNGGWSIILDAIPAPVDGQYKILLMVPKPREGQQDNRSSNRAPANRDDPRTMRRGDENSGFDGNELDDEIPF
jgi:hypothetical protein